MPADVECAKGTFNVLALTKNYNVMHFSFGHRYLSFYLQKLLAKNPYC